jgi:thiol-disulfide isomerase/thioredoxin
MTTDASSKPDATADADGQGEPALEGEGASSQIGIMYSEHTWTVPPWVKAVTFYVLVAAIGGLGVHEVQKRAQFRGLLVDSVVSPENWGNSPAPEIQLAAVYHEGKDGGGSVKLSDYKGKWVFVNFWATWCAPCRDEMPSMEMLNRRFKGEFAMIAVSVDDDQAQIGRFFGSDKPSFTVLWDSEKRFSNIYGSRKFPESYLIDPEGRIAAKFTGPRDWYNQGTVQYFDDILRGRRKPVI